uniref:TMEM164 family acyltransferase n=1 Tax=Akkermansia muciniphila TaxID=239935 RepID=UPI003FD8E6D6
MGVINPWTLAVSTPKYATAHAQGVRNHRAIKQTRAIRLQKCSGSQERLPLHFCSLMALVCVIALWFRPPWGC